MFKTKTKIVYYLQVKMGKCLLLLLLLLRFGSWNCFLLGFGIILNVLEQLIQMLLCEGSITLEYLLDFSTFLGIQILSILLGNRLESHLILLQVIG